MEKLNEGDRGFKEYEKSVPYYLPFAVVAVIFNPLLGIVAIVFSLESRRCVKHNMKLARRYSDLSFGFSLISVLSTVLIILMVYAAGNFPDNSYYDRRDVIRGYKTTSTVKTPVAHAVTTAAQAVTAAAQAVTTAAQAVTTAAQTG